MHFARDFTGFDKRNMTDTKYYVVVVVVMVVVVVVVVVIVVVVVVVAVVVVGSIISGGGGDDERWETCSLHVKRQVRPMLTNVTICPQTVTRPSSIMFHKNTSRVLRCYAWADTATLTGAPLQTIRCECPQQDMATLLYASSFASTLECFHSLLVQRMNKTFHSNACPLFWSVFWNNHIEMLSEICTSQVMVKLLAGRNLELLHWQWM